MPTGNLKHSLAWKISIFLPNFYKGQKSAKFGLIGCLISLITYIDLSTTPMTNGCHNDDVIQLGPLRSQSFYTPYLLLQYSSHIVISWILTSQIWKPQLRLDKFWSFYL